MAQNSKDCKFRQAANDKPYKVLTFKQLECHAEAVKGSIIYEESSYSNLTRVRQALPDIPNKTISFCNSKKHEKRLLMSQFDNFLNFGIHIISP